MVENYICINGKKTALTLEQIESLGFPVYSPLAELANDVRDGKHPFTIGKVIKDFCRRFKIIGYDHDVNATNAETNDVHTVTLMCLTTAPERQIHNNYFWDNSCTYDWVDSELRTWLNSDFFDTLPVGLRELICPTIRRYNDSAGNIRTTTDKLFIPTESELFGSAIYSACECGDRYEAFSTSKNRIVSDDVWDECCYFTSSPVAGNAKDFVCVNCAGFVDSDKSTNKHRVPFCFQLS